MVKPAVEGKEFTFHLSLIVNGAAKNYDFKFKVKEITKSVNADNSFMDAMNQDNSLKLEVGSKVKGNWKGQGIYYPGTIKEISGEQYFILYDDGDEEWVSKENLK